jgi:hypothetical protein
VGKWLEETLRNLWQHFFPLAPSIIIISDFKDEEHVERRAANQHVEVEQSIDFSSKPIQGRFFEVESNSLDIPIVVPTKTWFKCMMRHNGKEMIEGGLPSKVTWK